MDSVCRIQSSPSLTWGYISATAPVMQAHRACNWNIKSSWRRLWRNTELLRRRPSRSSVDSSRLRWLGLEAKQLQAHCINRLNQSGDFEWNTLTLSIINFLSFRLCIFHKYVLNRIGFTGGEELHFNLLKDSVSLPLAFIFRIFVFIHFFVFWRGKSNHRIRKVVKKVTMPARKKKSLVRKCRSILCWLADDPFDVDV